MADQSESNGSVQTIAEMYADQADSAKKTEDIPGIVPGDSLPEEQDPSSNGSTEPKADATGGPSDGSKEPVADLEDSTESGDGAGSKEPEAKTVNLADLSNEDYAAIMQHPRVVRSQDDLVRKTRGDIDGERGRLADERAHQDREDAILSGDQGKLAQLQQTERTQILQSRLQNTVALQIADGVHELLAADSHGAEWTDADRNSCVTTEDIFTKWSEKLIAGNNAKVEVRAKEIADARIQELEDARRTGIPAPSRGSGGSVDGGTQKPGKNATVAEMYEYEQSQAAASA